MERLATFLESAGGSFVAERAMYVHADWRSGHVNLGTPWSGTIASPTTAPSAFTITAVAPQQIRLSGGETITIEASKNAAFKAGKALKDALK